MGWLILKNSGRPLPGENGSHKVPPISKHLASWLFVNKEKVPFLRACGVEAFLKRQQVIS